MKVLVMLIAVLCVGCVKWPEYTNEVILGEQAVCVHAKDGFYANPGKPHTYVCGTAYYHCIAHKGRHQEEVRDCTLRTDADAFKMIGDTTWIRFTQRGHHFRGDTSGMHIQEKKL